MTRLLLSIVGDAGFALAGSGAIREHGVTSRPTEDVDLFTSRVGLESFARAIERGTKALQDAGYLSSSPSGMQDSSDPCSPRS
ncbi:hypothetical protein OSC27_13365 [Microbacterium sp. STN6]|uniref:hypothetical protein n=1 Tax=Microbacterium sp. STN6 TaxID=2995588 RepID=UPI002260AAE6|nr:hypothetical protein [Microbacterium sp. STN6]MCX7523261.1 hypothetical protein [Microbacterium sp. STN6]